MSELCGFQAILAEESLVAHPVFLEAKTVYRANITFTGVVEYGLTMEDLTSGRKAIPLSGARFDQTFEGTLSGPVLQGTIVGTDYLMVRADGVFRLHLHGRITTADGVNISMASEGVSVQVPGESLAQLRSTVELFTNSEEYCWLNRRLLWAAGTLDAAAMVATVRAYLS